MQTSDQNSLLTFPIFQILVKHIKIVLPELKARLNAQMIAVIKELRSYGETMESIVSLKHVTFVLNKINKSVIIH